MRHLELLLQEGTNFKNKHARLPDFRVQQLGMWAWTAQFPQAGSYGTGGDTAGRVPGPA